MHRERLTPIYAPKPLDTRASKLNSDDKVITTGNADSLTLISVFRKTSSLKKSVRRVGRGKALSPPHWNAFVVGVSRLATGMPYRHDTTPMASTCSEAPTASGTPQGFLLAAADPRPPQSR